MTTKLYVIAHHDLEEWQRFWITYYPVPYVFRSPSPMVTVFYGSVPSARQGSCLEPKEMLNWSPYIYYDRLINGKLWEPGPPGWFRRQCEAAGWLWFYPLVERMAAGEAVLIEEIKAAYRENNGSEELEQKPISELV